MFAVVSTLSIKAVIKHCVENDKAVEDTPCMGPQITTSFCWHDNFLFFLKRIVELAVSQILNSLITPATWLRGNLLSLSNFTTVPLLFLDLFFSLMRQ